jgi:hypothetical protein
MVEKSKQLEDEKRRPTGEKNGSEEGGREGERGVVTTPGHKDDDKEAQGR